MRDFHLEFEAGKPPNQLLREILRDWTGDLAANGYRLTSQSEVGVSFHRKYRHWGVILLAILLFPIGLLFLLITEDATITATVEPIDAAGSRLLVSGRGPKNVRRALETMEV
jgi:hypothetical protein